jgi:glycerol-3-phosphate O-acyltransferase/dihydroxyacetone phosphate acyltransferase
LATWKLLVALVLVPLLYALYSGLCALYLLKYRDASWLEALTGALLCYWSLPLIGYAAIRFGETGTDLYT